MFEGITGDASRRDVVKATAVGVGASLGLVGTVSATEDVVEFDESITITPEDSGTTFVQTDDFDGEVNIRPGVEDVTVDGNGFTITGGNVGGGEYLGSSITDLTLRNLHLPNGSVSVSGVSGLVLRNNVIRYFGSDEANGVRAVNNTVARGFELFENQADNVFWRNVAEYITLYDDLAGDHRISTNVITGATGMGGISVQVTNAFDGRMQIVDNYISNSNGAGIYLEDAFRLNPEINGNVIVGNGGDGIESGLAESLIGNMFVGNGGDGVGGELGSSVGTLAKNVAVSNDGVGFDVGVTHECQRNVAVSNGGDGFQVRSTGAKVKFNRATGNDGNGFVLEGSGFPFRKNEITANGGDGVVIDAADIGVTRNRICANDGEELVDNGDENGFANNLVY